MSVLSSQHQFAIEVVRQLQEAGYVALFAGGCVRDSLLGREAKDYDVATTASPDQVRTLFGRRRTLPIGASFGVIMVLGPKEAGQVEVATFRKEGPYLDGRRPESVAFCTPEEDARRRDFTINGMFFDPIEQRVLDFVDGQSDLKARVIRAIGDPHERVREDKLRMLRAVRFTATLDFTLDAVTADAIRTMSSELVVVSAERIAQELKKMLVDPHRRRAIQLTEEVNLTRIIFPELDVIRKSSAWEVTLKSLELLEQPSFELAMAVLLKPLNDVRRWDSSYPSARLCGERQGEGASIAAGKSHPNTIKRAPSDTTTSVHNICRRLKLSNDEIDRITWIVVHQADLDDASALSLAALKRILSHPYHEDLLKFMKAERQATGASMDACEFCRKFLTTNAREVIDPIPYVTGDDLIAMGMKPGPRFKSVLVSIRDAQLNLELLNRDEALKMARSEWNK